MRRLLKIGFLSGILSFTFISLPFALEVPPRPDGYVTDKAGLLPAPSRQKLEAFLRDFEKKTSNQVVVVTFPSLEGESLEDFSIRLAERWKIGQKGRDNGVIFLIFKNERRMRIEVGYGLEGVLPDVLAGQIIQQVVVPYFRKGDYENGILAGADAICRATAGEFKGFKKSPAGTGSSGDILFFILVFCFIVSLIDFARYGHYFGGHRDYPDRFNFLEWWFRFAILCFILRILFEILIEMRASSGRGSYGSGGGFSGGGGSFGGGGASGSW